MEQMKIAAEKVVPIDFDSDELPLEVKELRPVVFKEEASYWCLLGPDPHQGIFGSGDSPMDALGDWLANLRQRVTTTDPDDEVANYARDSLKISNRDVW
ncbi:hypothetical protein HX021_09825 [Sphingobacterium sp. N143]|uniref:hypothetical protein n=1 Tax=Sphingobacterium sp. N143 TaxID=2746727 RepID=UPI0025768FB4|nr:hypothetical protein [Sphingobacterium sp. N143]MDM1294589.1 hypothetical protein [Sphingobacterium sp. N143]